MNKDGIKVDMIDLFEEMLAKRAMTGFRPVLYVSCYTDLECNMVMLLDDPLQDGVSLQTEQLQGRKGYYVTTN